MCQAYNVTHGDSGFSLTGALCYDKKKKNGGREGGIISALGEIKVKIKGQEGVK